MGRKAKVGAELEKEFVRGGTCPQCGRFVPDVTKPCVCGYIPLRETSTGEKTTAKRVISPKEGL